MRWVMLLTCLVMSYAPPVLACSCNWESNLLYPQDSAIDVPTDAKIWIGSRWFGEVRPKPSDSEADGPSREERRRAGRSRHRNSHQLVDASAVRVEDEAGTPVPGEMSFIWKSPRESMYVAVFSPAASLKPSASYRVLLEGQALVRFKTGAGVLANAPPRIPQETRREITSSGFLPGGSCGIETYAKIFLDEAPFLTVIDRERTATFDATKLNGNVSSFGWESVAGIGTACDGSWSDAGPGARTAFRYGALDVTGRFSGWSDDNAVRVPILACTFVRTGKAVGVALEWWLLMAIVFVWHRRWMRGGP